MGLTGPDANWIIESDDKGRFGESDAMFDSDMKEYIDGQAKRGNSQYAKEVQRNVNLMKKWKAQGK